MRQHRIELTDKGGKLYPGRYDPELARMSKLMPGGTRWSGGSMSFVPNLVNLEVLEKHLAAEHWTKPARDALERERDLFRRAQAARLLVPGPEEAALPYRLPPMAHQLEAMALSKNSAAYAYLMDMGTGKSKLSIDVACYLYEKGEIDAIVVTAPNGVDEQWIDAQFPEHIWGRIPYKTMQLSTAVFKRTADLQLLYEMNSFQGLRCFAINTEALSHDSGVEVLSTLLRSVKAFLIVDESSRFKNPQAARTKALWECAQHAPYKRILSGTSITKGVENLYAQFRILGKNIVGSSTFSAFKAEFCSMGGFEGRQIVGYKNQEILLRRIQPFSFHVTKDLCMDLPPKVYMERVFTMNTEERAAYKQMRDELLLAVSRFGDDADPQVVFASHGAVSAMKLSQISRGFMFGAEETQGQIVWQTAKPSALQALEDVLDEAGDQSVAIWTNLRPEQDMIAEMLRKRGAKVARYAGTDEQKRDARNGFQDGTYTYFLSNAVSGGLGLNLQRGSLSVYYSHTGDAEIRWQSEDRLWRKGQDKTVTIVDLICKGSRDRHIRGVVGARGVVAKTTLGALRNQLLADTF